MKKPSKTPPELALEHFMDTVSSAIAEGLAHPNLDHEDAMKSLAMSLIVSDGVNSSDENGLIWIEGWEGCSRPPSMRPSGAASSSAREGSPMDLNGEGMKVKRVDARRPS